MTKSKTQMKIEQELSRPKPLSEVTIEEEQLSASPTTTPIDLSSITVEHLKEWALKQDHTRSNPTSGGTMCLYNGPNGDHCIAGQFLADHGFDVKKLKDTIIPVKFLFSIYDDRINGDVLDRLSVLQRVADVASTERVDDIGDRGPWGYAIDKVFGEAS